eukprot:Sspe_Gene.15299::Locus_5321_Transcript_1_1_Confidence_1.000_Length_2265::g.15299::m.15299
MDPQKRGRRIRAGTGEGHFRRRPSPPSCGADGCFTTFPRPPFPIPTVQRRPHSCRPRSDTQSSKATINDSDVQHPLCTPRPPVPPKLLSSHGITPCTSRANRSYASWTELPVDPGGEEPTRELPSPTQADKTAMVLRDKTLIGLYKAAAGITGVTVQIEERPQSEAAGQQSEVWPAAVSKPRVRAGTKQAVDQLLGQHKRDARTLRHLQLRVTRYRKEAAERRRKIRERRAACRERAKPLDVRMAEALERKQRLDDEWMARKVALTEREERREENEYYMLLDELHQRRVRAWLVITAGVNALVHLREKEGQVGKTREVVSRLTEKRHLRVKGKHRRVVARKLRAAMIAVLCASSMWTAVLRKRSASRIVVRLLRCFLEIRPARVIIRSYYQRVLMCQRIVKNWLLARRARINWVSRAYQKAEARLLSELQKGEQAILQTPSSALSGRELFKKELMEVVLRCPRKGKGRPKEINIPLVATPAPPPRARASVAQQPDRRVSRGALPGIPSNPMPHTTLTHLGICCSSPYAFTPPMLLRRVVTEELKRIQKRRVAYLQVDCFSEEREAPSTKSNKPRDEGRRLFTLPSRVLATMVAKGRVEYCRLLEVRWNALASKLGKIYLSIFVTYFLQEVEVNWKQQIPEAEKASELRGLVPKHPRQVAVLSYLACLRNTWKRITDSPRRLRISVDVAALGSDESSEDSEVDTREVALPEETAKSKWERRVRRASLDSP